MVHISALVCWRGYLYLPKVHSQVAMHRQETSCSCSFLGSHQRPGLYLALLLPTSLMCVREHDTVLQAASSCMRLKYRQ